jgi:hypothetical protein
MRSVQLPIGSPLDEAGPAERRTSMAPILEEFLPGGAFPRSVLGGGRRGFDAGRQRKQGDGRNGAADWIGN